MPEFFCFYKKVFIPIGEYPKRLVPRSFYPEPLNQFVNCGDDVYRLIKDKPLFWRTFNQSEMNGESFYYQQIVTKKVIFNTTFEKEKGELRSWKG
jgi:hypothetical protein